MAKRGETLPWKMTACFEGGKPFRRAFHSEERALAAAEMQARTLGPSGEVCTVVVRKRETVAK